MGIGEDEEKKKLVEEIAEECKTVTHEDRCEMAILIGKCMADGAEKRNLKME